MAASSSAASPAALPAPVVSLLSTGCNRAATAMVWLARTDARWFPEGLVAYAAGRNLAIYDPHLQTIVAILRGHNARVNAVHWITGPNDEAADQSSSLLQLASGSADKQLLIWQYDPATRHYAVQARLSGHEDGISAVTAIALPAAPADSKQLALVASTSTDLTTRIWVREIDTAADTVVFAAASLRDANEPAAAAESGGWRCTQILPSGRHKIMHCLSLVYVPLPSSSALRGLLMLAVGGVDSRIHLWMAGVGPAAASLQFLSATSLEGHENWITSLDWARMNPEPASASSVAPVMSLMLASASQDKHIRLWKLQISAPAGADASAAAVTSTSLGSRGHILAFAGLSIFVVLESVLLGHENWVMSAKWQPPVMRPASGAAASTGGAALERHQPMCLLSASTDKSMLLWRPTSGPEGLWSHEVRVGDMGGHTLGFYGCAFHPAGTAILTNGYSGSLHLWREDSASGRWLPAVTVSGHAGPVNDMTWDAQADYLLTTSSDQTTRLFAPWVAHTIPTVSGAAAAASSSSSSPAVVSRPTWHEISRPQLHGYDLNCLAPLHDPTHTRAHALASGADEKVLRVFWAPTPFLQTLKQIAGVDTIEAGAGTAERPKEAAVLVDENKMGGAGGDDDEDGGGAMEERKISPAPAATAAPSKSSVAGPNAEQLAFLEQSSARALKANLPELGLSNKALREGEAANTLRGMQHVQEVSSAADRSASIPPPEDYLLTSTLWPEIEKLYGHGFELVSLACSFDGALLASGCTAKKTQHAVVRVWDTKSWSERFVLESHRATIVQMAFSPSDEYLLTASRDRHVSLFRFAREGGAAASAASAAAEPKIVHVGTTKTKAHARIIWSVSWLPVLGAHWFVTGSRDKSVKLFRVSAAGAAEEDSTLPVFAQSVTAVAFAPLAPSSPASGILFPHVDALRASATEVTIAVGMEDGCIELWQATIVMRPAAEAAKGKTQWTKLYAFESKFVDSATSTLSSRSKAHG